MKLSYAVSDSNRAMAVFKRKDEANASWCGASRRASAVRTCVRVEHPARGPRFVLRLRRAAGRSTVARTAGDRRGRGRARRELRGEGTRRLHADGRAARAPAVPRCGRRLATVRGVLRGVEGGL